MISTESLQELRALTKLCAEAPSEPDGPPPRTAVLLVDDEPMTLKYLQRALGEQHSVYLAFDARGALQQLEAHPEIGAVVTDLRLPGPDGVWLAGEIKHRHPGVAVVGMTGYHADAPRLGGRVDRLFFKPFDFGDLARAVGLLVLKAAL